MTATIAQEELREVLSRFYEVEPCAFDPRATMLTTRTPAATFVSVLQPTEFGYLKSTACNGYDARLAQDILERARRELPLSEPVQVIDEFSSAATRFSALLALGPSAHGAYAREHPQLNRQTIEVYPIDRCEFSEKPSLDEVKHRRRSLRLCDARRDPSPLVRLRRLPASNRSKVKLDLADLGLVKHQCGRLTDVFDGALEVQNYRGQRWRVEGADGGHRWYSDAQPGNGVWVAADDLDATLTGVFFQGATPIQPSLRPATRMSADHAVAVFVCDPRASLHIPDTRALNVPLSTAIGRFQRLSDHPDVFFGIINPQGQTLQFAPNPDGSWVIDIPLAEQRASYVCNASKGDCVRLLESLPRQIRPVEEGFELVPYGSVD